MHAHDLIYYLSLSRVLSSQVCEACKGELPLMHLKGMGRIRWDKDVAYIEAVNQRSPRQGATSPRKGSISPPRDGASPRKDKPAGPPPSRPFPDPPGSDGRRSPKKYRSPGGSPPLPTADTGFSQADTGF